MQRRTFIVGTAAALTAIALPDRLAAKPKTKLTKAARAKVKALERAIKNYVRTARSEDRVRLGQGAIRDTGSNRAQVVRKYGTARANTYANQLEKTKMTGTPTPNSVERFKKAVVRMKKDLERRKKRIDDEIKRRKEVAERKPEKGQHVKYLNALKDESKYLKKVIKALGGVIDAAAALKKQLEKDKKTAAARNKEPTSLPRAAPPPAGAPD